MTWLPAPPSLAVVARHEASGGLWRAKPHGPHLLDGQHLFDMLS